MRVQFTNLSNDHFKFFTKKVFVYMEKSIESCMLPPTDAFYKLIHENSSQENCEHAQTIWQKFEIKHLASHSALLKCSTDVDMIMFIEKAICGGAVCCGRFLKVSNNHMAEHEPEKSSKYFKHLDVNNLYGFAQCEPLRFDGFKSGGKCQTFF